MRKIYLETFGCQMNKLDSELVAGDLLRKGFDLTPRADEADVILFNTCSVREHAEQKVYSRLGQLKRRKERQPDLVLGVIGCMAENVREDLFDKLPHLDLICGPGELHQVPALIEEASTRHTQAVALAPAKRKGKPFVDPNDDPLEQLDLGRTAAAAAGGTVREDPWRAYIRVQRGCNHMCAFCIVPYTRGKEV
jgi:tRNA-2-methylthio-N6-dimethylallyladenosine synthase